MNDEEKTREQLIQEVRELRLELARQKERAGRPSPCPDRGRAETEHGGGKRTLSEERYCYLTEFLPVGAYEFDLNGRFSYVNRAVTRLLGYTSEEALGMRMDDVVAPEERAATIREIAEILEGHNIVSERTFLRKDGKKFIGETHSSPMHEGSQIVGIRGVVMDITTRRKAEEELLRADRLESIGVLSGGIAHDFNNILTSVLGNLNLAEPEVAEGSPAAQYLNEAIKAAVRARELTQQLLTFARGGAPIKKSTSLKELIRESARFSFTGTKVQLHNAVPAETWPVDVDEGQIAQVINNLAINAIQAMPDGGFVEIAARNVRADEILPAGLKKGRYVKLSFRDHGVGIPAALLAKVFDPYFTTKEKGSGLGLAICYTIVHRHQGVIEVESAEGRGTTFHIFLPATEQRLPANEAIRRQFTGRGRILVMDDDEMIRIVLQSMLVQLGHEVTMTVDGAAAIERYQAAQEAKLPFDVVIMDLVVPGGMGGVDAMTRLQQIDPRAKVIVSSGYADDPVVANYQQYGFAGYLCKPYRFDELVGTLARVMSST